MNNLYESSKNNESFRQLECEGALMVEFKCSQHTINIHDYWAEYPHIVFVSSGKKQWISTDEEITALKGEAVFLKKGAYKVRSFYEEEFCALLFFLTEDFIRATVIEFVENISTNALSDLDFNAIKINTDENLNTYFNSIIGTLFQNQNPSDLVLRLKFKELILQVLTSKANSQLTGYFLSTIQEEKMNLKRIMEENLLNNLSLEEYARLCYRSLSSFKRDFYQIFGISPGKWLTVNRLKYARMRLLYTNDSINDVAFHCGFETTSHFIRCFRKQFGQPPLQFRQHSLSASKGRYELRKAM